MPTIWSIIKVIKLHVYYVPMNPLLNPALLLRVARSYISDMDKLREPKRKILSQREKSFKKIFKIALRTPLYSRKYKEIKRVNGTEDIHKLPILTKDELRNATNEELLPRSGKKFYMVSTSGSTGKPITLFTEPFTMFKTLIGFARIIREHGIRWNKTRMAIIADLSAGSAEEVYFSGVAIPSLRTFFPLKNIISFHVGEDPKKIMEELERFKPEFIGGYPGILKILAIMKNRGFGEGIKPRWMATSGAVLDDYTRKYIEDAFEVKIFDVYGATECSPIAFQCREGNYHVNYDLVHVEYLDDEGNPVSSGKLANIVVTRLFGDGTPIIRYSGLNDLVVPFDGNCACGMDTPIIKRIEGRRVDTIILPDGRLIPPSSFTGIPYKVMLKYGTKKIEQFQIIQHDYNKIEVLIVMDEGKEEPKDEVLLDELRKAYEGVFGEDVEVKVRKVKEITERREGVNVPPPVVISKVKKE